MNNPKVLGVIPARYASVRFPGKPLAEIIDKPMIQWVYENALKSKLLNDLIVATDDQRIYDAVTKFGGNAQMTESSLRNGTERVAIIAEKHTHDIIVNIQGDEPLIDPNAIDIAIRLLIDDPVPEMATLVKKIKRAEELLNPNFPKVILDSNNIAIYFSRTPIPCCPDCEQYEQWLFQHVYYGHIGLYVYRKKFLMKFISLPESSLEKIEKLEQLRAIENGYKIKAAVVDQAPQGVDTPEDLERIIKYIKGHHIG